MNTFLLGVFTQEAAEWRATFSAPCPWVHRGWWLVHMGFLELYQYQPLLGDSITTMISTKIKFLKT
jgi:hypothetical protein